MNSQLFTANGGIVRTREIFCRRLSQAMARCRRWKNGVKEGMTPAELAEKTGISPARLAALFTGALPELDELLAVADATGASLDWLLGREEQVMASKRSQLRLLAQIGDSLACTVTAEEGGGALHLTNTELKEWNAGYDAQFDAAGYIVAGNEDGVGDFAACWAALQGRLLRGELTQTAYQAALEAALEKVVGRTGEKPPELCY